MSGIHHILNIKAPIAIVFKGITTPKGLNHWWTKKSVGKPEQGTIYQLDFGINYQWEASVTKLTPNKAFELQMTTANEEWKDTKVGFLLSEHDGNTELYMYHKGWKKKSRGYKFSNYCWAMYLRILKRYLETGETVPYEKRLSV